MPHLVIISSSIRQARKSHNVTLYFQKYLLNHNLSTVEILDLKVYNFPIFNNTIKLLQNPTDEVSDFAAKIKSADGIIIITPEYNGGFPASLKNVIDLLYDEWHGKPISVVTVSSGPFGGTQALSALQFALWKIGAWMVTNMFCVSNVAATFDDEGNASDKAETDKLADAFIKEMLDCIKVNRYAAIA